MAGGTGLSDAAADAQRRLISSHARATGLLRIVPTHGTVSAILAFDFNNIMMSAYDTVGEIYYELAIDQSMLWGDKSKPDNSGIFCDATIISSRISQYVSYIENVHLINNKIIEIGSLYNSLKNTDLRERCSDLLTAASHFDRAINQATLVLEEKIRSKAELDKSLLGASMGNYPGL